jgi:hypothetical protein
VNQFNACVREQDLERWLRIVRRWQARDPTSFARESPLCASSPVACTSVVVIHPRLPLAKASGLLRSRTKPRLWLGAEPPRESRVTNIPQRRRNYTAEPCLYHSPQPRQERRSKQLLYLRAFALYLSVLLHAFVGVITTRPRLIRSCSSKPVSFPLREDSSIFFLAL